MTIKVEFNTYVYRHLVGVGAEVCDAAAVLRNKLNDINTGLIGLTFFPG